MIDILESDKCPLLLMLTCSHCHQLRGQAGRELSETFQPLTLREEMFSKFAMSQMQVDQLGLQGLYRVLLACPECPLRFPVLCSSALVEYCQSRFGAALRPMGGPHTSCVVLSTSWILLLGLRLLRENPSLWLDAGPS